MFERRVDQADGLRRMFGHRERALLPVASLVGASLARRALDHLVERVRIDGHVATVIEISAQGSVGDLYAAIDAQRDTQGNDRIIVVAKPELIGQVFGPQLDAMLLMLTSDPARLQAQYVDLKALAERRGVRRFGVGFVDGDDRRASKAYKILQGLAIEFLGCEIDLIRGWRFPPRQARSQFELPMSWVQSAARSPAVRAVQRYDAIAREPAHLLDR